MYLPDGLADAVKEAQLPVSAICQTALERAVRDVVSARAADDAPRPGETGIGVFGRFTPRARRAIELAEEAARAAPHDAVGTEHLLLGMIDEGTNLGLRVLRSIEIEIDDLRRELVGSMPPACAATPPTVAFTALAKQAIEATTKEALALGHNYIGCEHLLLGLLATEEGLASRVLRRLGLELRTVRRAIVAALSGYVHAQADHAAPAPAPLADPSALERILQRLDAIEARLAP